MPRYLILFSLHFSVKNFEVLKISRGRVLFDCVNEIIKSSQLQLLSHEKKMSSGFLLKKRERAGAFFCYLIERF